MGKILGGVIVAVILVGGWWWWSQTKTAEAPGTALVPSPVTSEMNESIPLQADGLVSSIKDAMGFGKKMQCTFSTKTEKGDAFQSTLFVNGTVFKSVTEMGDMTAYGLFDGTDQYTWTTESKEGYKMSKACMEEFRKLTPSQESEPVSKPKIEDFDKQFDMAQNVNCIPALSADFDVPKDITFTDQCAMMKQTVEMMNQMKGQLPAGMQIPGMPSGNE